MPAPFAQAPLTPGAVQDTLGPKKPPAKAPPAQMVFPKAPPPPVAHDPKARRFTVNAFHFTGNSVYSEQMLKRLTERFIDLQLNLYDLSRAADTRNPLLPGEWATRSRAPSCPRRKSIRASSASSDRRPAWARSGSRAPRATRRIPRWAPRRAHAGALITSDGLEQDLLLLNDIPGLTARATLEPGKKFGTTDVTIRLEERAFSAVVRPNNHGRKEIGQWRVDAGASLNNPLGLGDQLSVYGIYSEHGLLKYGRASYSVPVSSRGTRLEAAVSSSDYRVEGDIAALGVTGDARNREITLTHPLFRTRARSLSMNLGARSTELRQRAFGIDSNTQRSPQPRHGVQQSARIHRHQRERTGTQFQATTSPVRTRKFKLGSRAPSCGHRARLDTFRGVVYAYSPDPLPQENFSRRPGSVRGYRPPSPRRRGILQRRAAPPVQRRHRWEWSLSRLPDRPISGVPVRGDAPARSERGHGRADSASFRDIEA